MSTKFLDDSGLSYFWGKLKTYLNAIISTYLPLSGGTMSGAITRNGNLAQSGSASGSISIFNGTGASSGGGIWLYGKSHSNAGKVRLQAYNGTYYQLDVNSDGTTTTDTIFTISKSNSTVNKPAILTSGSGQNHIIAAVDTSVTKGTAPSASKHWGINFYGKDYDNVNKRIGLIETTLLTSNAARTSLIAYNCTTNTNTSVCAIRAIVDGSGNAYTEAPTPSVGDNSTKIATTAYVQGEISGFVVDSAVVHKTGNETIAGTKNFTSEPQWNGLDISGKSSNYCADCNSALVPGRYYIDSNTLHAPDCVDGILFCYGIGGANDIVFQEVFAKKYSSATWRTIERRIVTVSNGSYSSANPWTIHNYYSYASGIPLFVYGENNIILSPPRGFQMHGQGNSHYEFIRLYHVRDVQRDADNTSYGLIGRFTDSKNPKSGEYNNAYLDICGVEGGITTPRWYIVVSARCASNVTYTDSTSELVYGEFLKKDDVHSGKTVSSVSYVREANAARIAFEIDNLATLGSSTLRFATLYAGTGTIDTSDERLKDSIGLIPDEVLDAWGGVVWLQYRFRDAVGEKGAGARLHTGAVAQYIDSIFRERGLDASRYGLFCYDRWDDEYGEDEDGVRHRTQEAGDRYSLRYEEALAMEAAYMRRENARLKKRLSDLEDRLAALELRLGSA